MTYGVILLVVLIIIIGILRIEIRGYVINQFVRKQKGILLEKERKTREFETELIDEDGYWGT